MESYTGKIEPMGMSIFMQGSHQLIDDNGDVIVLLNADEGVDLDRFSGKKVKVTGNVEDTVEAGGRIVTVVKVDSL